MFKWIITDITEPVDPKIKDSKEKITIRFGDQIIGKIQKIKIQENRNSNHGIPLEHADINGSCAYIRFDRSQITEIFTQALICIVSQRMPFDIHIIDNKVTTILKNVWTTNISYSYYTENYILIDNMDYEAESIIVQS